MCNSLAITQIPKLIRAPPVNTFLTQSFPLLLSSGRTWAWWGALRLGIRVATFARSSYTSFSLISSLFYMGFCREFLFPTWAFVESLTAIVAGALIDLVGIFDLG